MIVVGDKERDDKVVAVRHRKEGDLGVMSLDEFIAKLQLESDSKEIK